MQISEIQLYRLVLTHLPLKRSGGVAPLTQTIDAFVMIKTKEGITGHGVSYHPIHQYHDEDPDETFKFLKKVKSSLLGQDPSNIKEIHELMDKKIPKGKNVPRTAIDTACYDIIGKAKNKPVYQLLGGDKPNIAPTSMNGDLDNVKQLIEKYRSNGLQIIKFKLVGSLKEDKKRINAITKMYKGKLVLTGGKFKDPKEVVTLLKEVYEEYSDRILLIEQPTSPPDNLSKLKYVSDRSDIPVYVYSRYKTIEDIHEIIAKDAVKGIYLNLVKAGGLYWCSKIADLAEKNNMGLSVGIGGVDGLGVTIAAHLAAGKKTVSRTDLTVDLLDPNKRIIKDETAPIFKNGARIPSQRPGLGIELKDWVKMLLNETITIKKEG